VSYEEDLIQFHVLDEFDDAEFDMAITLNLQLFSGQTVSSTKRIKLSFQDERHYDKSLNLTTPDPLLTYKGVELKSHPFSTFTFVRLMRNSYQIFS
jgi:ureidoglycolate hydrolase